MLYAVTIHIYGYIMWIDAIWMALGAVETNWIEISQ